MRTGGCRAHSRRSSPQVRGAGSGTEAQLRVSWDGILNAERTGRWWIVGSAWTGAPMIDSSRQKVPQKQLAGTVCGPTLTPPGVLRWPRSVSRWPSPEQPPWRMAGVSSLTGGRGSLKTWNLLLFIYNLTQFLLLLFKRFI